MDSVYYVAIIRSYFGPKEVLSFASYWHGGRIEFGSAADARAWIGVAESERYELAHNEASRPDYIVVDQDTVAWIDSDDCDKFDWDDCECHDGEGGEACGMCDECYELMLSQGIKYVREHAIMQDTAEA